MPRCTRCNAPLSATPPGGDATTPDEPPAPPAPPWTASPQGPGQWDTPPPPDQSPPGQPGPPGPPGPEYTTPMPPTPDETSTLLSPEPWSVPPGGPAPSEPAIWRPPPPPKASRTPYFLVAAGVVLLLGLALGIVFWPSGSGTSADPGSSGGPSTQQSQDAVPQSETPSGDVGEQAKAVDALLAEMGTTRSDLGSVVVGGCEASGLQRVLDARRSQLEKARSLDVTALDNGAQMRDALVRALEASSESNQRYLDVAPGCPSDGEVSDVNQRASDAKNEFIGYWTPIAQQAGLPARTADDI
ncbi:hypothetical protein E1264_38325 [Actinomadura sp. KC216]|uniref:hypothetical protein n=1 Tax=Actinomadura sp. KC216 TaxID=2530370 RepID=UPI001047F75B|nr:hypothetical protein [Actinomadura sp. KC216]TDB76597.1 hypothetical protein E1264_38325 [Actinomadura sp. KC216]